MKETKKTEGASPVKVKRRTLYTILIAACALVLAAAVTLTVVFVVRGSDTSLEQPDDGKDDDNDDGNDDGTDDTDDGDDDDTPGSTEVVFALPVAEATVGATYSFWYNSTLNRYGLHTGVDFKAPAGTQVTAAYGGTVESITDTLLEGGKVVIDHGNGLKSEYASIDVADSLRVGGSIERGDLIGTVSAAADAMGNEYNEGEHLHFAVNTVAYTDGKMYAEGVSDWHGLRGYIQGLMPKWYVDFRISGPAA